MQNNKKLRRKQNPIGKETQASIAPSNRYKYSNAPMPTAQQVEDDRQWSEENQK